MEKVYYTVKEFAEILSVCEHTVRAAIKARRIIGVRLGPDKQSPYRIHYSQLEKLMLRAEGEEDGL